MYWFQVLIVYFTYKNYLLLMIINCQLFSKILLVMSSHCMLL